MKRVFTKSNVSFLIHSFPSIAYGILNFDGGFQTPLLHYKKETDE